jgi:hypothetical protein
LPENASAWELFQHSTTQLITSFGGVVGINYHCVELVAKKLDIEFDGLMFKKINVMERVFLDNVNQPPEPKAKKSTDTNTTG